MHRLAFCLSVAGLLLWSGCGKPPVPPAEQADYGSVRDQVVEQIKSGKINVDQEGVATLAPDFESASINGRVIAGQTSAAGWVVAFPLQQGRTAIQCLLYIEKTAPPSGQSLQVGRVTFTVGNQAEGRWYRVVLASLL